MVTWTVPLSRAWRSWRCEEGNDREQREILPPVHVPPNKNTRCVVVGVALLVFGAAAYAANLGLGSHETVAEGAFLWRSNVRWDSRGVHAEFHHSKGGLFQDEARVACVALGMLPELVKRCVEETVEQATAEERRTVASRGRARSPRRAGRGRRGRVDLRRPRASSTGRN